VAVYPALTYIYIIKKPVKYLLSICFIFSLFIVSSSFIIFNVYAQQGGTATGGNAQGGAGISGPAPCYNCTYNIYGGQATGGPATGGNAIGSGSGGGQGGSSQVNSTLNNNSYPNNPNPVVLNTQPPSFKIAWGSLGSKHGQFSEPYGITVGSSGNVYVVDTDNHLIQKFSPFSPN
jgi:hypothetical protein